MLTNQQTVEFAIIHFVALEVIMEFPKMYYEALADNALKKVCHHPVKREHKGRSIAFLSRTCFHKLGRILYKINRSLYVSVVFYFFPFLVIFLSYFITKAVCGETTEE